MGVKSVIYKKNAKLPRLGKKEFATSVLTKEMYESVKEGFPSISWKEFQEIWVAIAEEIKSEVCSNPLGVKLPMFLGDLKIQYLPYKLNAVDYDASQQVGEPVPPANIHSKGKVGKIIWERKEARRFNKVLELWAFQESDLFREQGKEALMENPDKFRIARTRVGNKTILQK